MSSQSASTANCSASADGSSSSCPTVPSAMQIDVPQTGRAAVSDEGTDASRMAMAPPRRLPPTGPTNVGELVAKAKKAAASLWMILHAQNCRATGNCPHRGCSETKRLLIHVKTCPASNSPNIPCPTQCKGCRETRKLLAHYRRCKDMRVKQVGLGRRSGLQPDQSCLVCSLMARYAKTMMDRSTAGKNNNAAAANLLCQLKATDAKFSVERGLSNNFNDLSHQEANVCTPVVDGSPSLGLPKRSSSMILMPPPPPRFGSAPTRSSTFKKKCLANESFGAYPSLLGRSVDSTVRVPFPILRHPSPNRGAGRTINHHGLVVPGLTTATSSPRRRRAESYDERKRSVNFAPTVITSEQYYRNDQEDGQLLSSLLAPTDENRQVTRPRSASCSNMGSNNDGNNATMPSSSARGCDTIAEEVVEHVEEPLFRMD